MVRVRLVGGFLLIYTTTGQRDSNSPEPENEAFELIKGDEEGEAQTQVQINDEATAGDQISAADYNPNLDRREDEQKRVHKDEDVEMLIEEEYEEEDDVDDMFAVASDKPRTKKVRKVLVGYYYRCRDMLY